MTALSRLAVI